MTSNRLVFTVFVAAATGCAGGVGTNARRADARGYAECTRPASAPTSELAAEIDIVGRYASALANRCGGKFELERWPNRDFIIETKTPEP